MKAFIFPFKKMILLSFILFTIFAGEGSGCKCKNESKLSSSSSSQGNSRGRNPGLSGYSHQGKTTSQGGIKRKSESANPTQQRIISTKGGSFCPTRNPSLEGTSTPQIFIISPNPSAM